MKLDFLKKFFKKSQIFAFMKIRPVGSELFSADGQTNGRTDGQTDLTKLIVAFRNFANESKMLSPCLSSNYNDEIVLLSFGHSRTTCKLECLQLQVPFPPPSLTLPILDFVVL